MPTTTAPSRSVRARGRAFRLRAVAGEPELGRRAPELRAKLIALASRQDGAAENDWDDDPDHLAQAVDAALDKALEAFQSGETDQGVALTVAASASVDALLAAMNLADADELGPDPAGALGMAGKSADGVMRDNLFRASERAELREAAGDTPPTLFGHFAVFNEWAEIHSLFEGDFLERFDPASMNKTFAEDRAAMRVLLNHGHDPQLGDKPIGPIDTLEAQKRGAYYEVPLFRGIPDLVLEGIRAGQYGASLRFQVTQEQWNQKPDRSKYNPDRLPERTILEARVREFGPTPFPAYSGATAGVRSLTDDYLLRSVSGDPAQLHDLLHRLTGRPGARSAGGGDSPDVRPGHGRASSSLSAMQAQRDRDLRYRRIIRGN